MNIRNNSSKPENKLYLRIRHLLILIQQNIHAKLAFQISQPSKRETLCGAVGDYVEDVFHVLEVIFY